MKSIVWTILSVALVAASVSAKELACIPRSEMGETATGENLYERDADLKISNLSRIDFELLTITSAEGNLSKLIKVADNVYKTDSTSKFDYYFITNNTRSIVTEQSLSDTAAYIKVLLCK